MHHERKPFAAMFTCQGLGALSGALRRRGGDAAARGDDDAARADDVAAVRYAGEARDLLDRILGWTKDPSPLGKPGCAGAPYRPWNVPMIALSLLESLREVGGIWSDDADALYEAEARRCVDELLDHIVEEKRIAVENVDAATNSYVPATWEGRVAIPGHALEASWFLMEWARRVGDAGILARALQLCDWSWIVGWDAEHGGLLYFVDAEGGADFPFLEKDMKLWWVHTEAMHFRRADMPPMNRGDAAAATRIVRGDELRRPRRGESVETSRGDAAAATRIVRGDESRRRPATWTFGRDRRAPQVRGSRGHGREHGQRLRRQPRQALQRHGALRDRGGAATGSGIMSVVGQS